MLTIGSLFSGIGGLELGLEWAGLGPVQWQVEREPYCRAVLEQHWPGVDRFDDVCAVGADLPAVDLICGGFPCQDVSSAGSRAGLAGSRSGLWREFSRVVGLVRPRWVVVENVASGATRWMDAVVGDLERQGYACLPLPLSARDVGAPHRRERIFIVARHVDGQGQPARALDAEVEGASRAAADADGEPHTPKQMVHCSKSQGDWGKANAADAYSLDRAAWSNGSRRPEMPGRPEPAESHWGCNPEPDMVRVVHGVSRRLDSPSSRIRALGNAVVPQCAEVVGWVIRELEGR